MRLFGKNAIITGASSGIGKAAALRFAREGANLLLLDVAAEALTQTTAEARAHGVRAESLDCDVSSETQVAAAVARCISALGSVDILVNVAGIQVTKLLENTSFDEYQRMMNINLGGTFLTIKHVLPHMKSQRSGAIVNVASELAFVGYPELSLYTATKGAMVSMTRSLSLEAIRYGVRANCICPGATDTPIFWEGETDPARRAELLERVAVEKPIGRLITVEEVASGILFLASDEASGVVCACLVMDGGFTAQ